MADTGILLSEDGQPLLAESGEPLLAQQATSNADIQQFDFSVNLLQAILWQYNNAPNLQGLLEAKNTWYFYNQQQFWNYWFNNVFNLATADDFGLSVWSIILGQPTYINNGPAPADYPAWGFGQYHKNFGNGNFSNTNGATYQLPTQWARLLLQLRYFQLTSSGTVPEINRMLKYLFAVFGPAWLVDNGDMTQTYFFNFQIPAGMQLIFENFDVLPRPAGVLSSYYQGNYMRWGFGQYHANFGNGNFVGSN
jgi:hypothetical protein